MRTCAAHQLSWQCIMLGHHGMRNTRHIGAIVKRCLGIGQGAMKSQTILLCKTPLSFAHLPDFGYQAITNMRRAGRYIRGMSSEERRVGKECGSTCGSRGSPDH